MADIDLPFNLVAFVTDSGSEHIITNLIKDMNMAYTEVIHGGMTNIIEYLQNNRSPRILLIDISDIELALNEIVKIKEVAVPSMNILVIGGKNEVGLYRDLINVGVSDYLVKPLNKALLKASIDHINGLVVEGEDVFRGKTGKLIHVISANGGAGATTISTNIAWMLANNFYKRTAIIDLDFLFGTINILLDLKAENAYLDLIESPDKIDEYFLETVARKHGQRLFYIGGLVDLARGVVIDKESYKAFLEIVKRQFNYIVTDSQRDLFSSTRVSMGLSNILIVVVELSIMSAQNAARLLELINADYANKRIIVIANKVGLSNRASLSKESFEKVIGRKIDYMIPIDENYVLSSANIGQPLAITSASPVTPILENIVDNILGKIEHKTIDFIKEEEETILNNIKEKILNMIAK